MSALTIIAKIEAKRGSEQLVKSELLKLIEPTRNEEGCIQYDLHQDNSTPGIFLFVENWATRELWQKHMQSSHSAQFGAATEGHTLGIELNEMTKQGLTSKPIKSYL